MWYNPPFFVIFSILIGLGVDIFCKKSPKLGIAIGLLFIISILIQLPTAFQLEREVQVEYEDGVRRLAGKALDRLMSEHDTATFEALGYIGWEIRPKTAYDYPGLGSPTSVRILSEMEVPSMDKLIARLLPDFLVLRPNELKDLQRNQPDAAARYSVVERFSSKAGPQLRSFNVVYRTVDHDFIILERMR